MRLIIRDFLMLLKERTELDRLLPDLLLAQGFVLVKLAFPGEVEHGIDVAALKREGSKDKLYLFQVKSGDIDPRMWDEGPNSVRASLNNIVDVHFEELSNPRLRNADRIVVVVHNGELRENCRQKWNGYTGNYKYPVERWGLGELTDLVAEHLMNEYLLPENLRHLLRKTLAFIDVEGYSYEHFFALLNQYLIPADATRKPREIKRMFYTLRLMMSLVHKYAGDANNLKPSILLSERALLAGWDYAIKSKDFRKVMKGEITKTANLWFTFVLQYIVKLEPLAQIEDGLFLNGPQEIVEYPLRCHDILATLGLAVIVSSRYNQKEMAEQIGKILAGILKNNLSGCSRVLLDNQLISIYFGMSGLLLTNYHNLAQLWLREILGHLGIRKQIGKTMPELHNRIDQVIEAEFTNQKPVLYDDKSSTLIYFLFELLLFFGDNVAYEKYRKLLSEEVNLQVWYPSEDIEEELFIGEVYRRGKVETSIKLPESFEEFYEDVKKRHSCCDSEELETYKQELSFLVLLANKHFKTPVFPIAWRASIFH
jgi:hypothetical protein